MNQDNLKFIHNTIIHWIDKTDIKAHIFLGIQLVILGYFTSYFNNIDFGSCYKKIVFGFFIFFTILVLFFIFKVIWPRLSTNRLKSFIYFKDIYDKYAKSDQPAIEDFDKISKQEFENDLVNQLVSLSIVAMTKYKDLQKMMMVLGFEIILVILLFI